MVAMKDVYSYNPDTLEYSGVSTAYESPLEEGVFYYPKNTSANPPPAYDQSTQSCRYLDGAWTVSELPPKKLIQTPAEEELTLAKQSSLWAERAYYLTSTDWLVMRHRDELSIGLNTTLTPSNFTSLLEYRQRLRDITKLEGYPNVGLPVLNLGG